MLSEDEVRTIVAQHGARLHDVVFTNATAPDYGGNLEYRDQPDQGGWMASKQYTVLFGQVGR